MREIKQINDMCKKNQSNLECIHNDQSLILNMLKNILVLLDKLEHMIIKHMRIKNKGTDAGGANTNKTGLRYEDITHLPTLLNIKSTKKIFGKGINDCYYVYKKYIILKQSGLHKYLRNYYIKCEKKNKPRRMYYRHR